MPSRKEFAASIKAKYPAYADVPDDQLVDAMLAKYPTYKSQVDSYEGTPGYADAATRAIARASGGIVPPQKQVNDAGEEVGAPAGPMGNFFRNTIRNPMVQGAANPTSASDVASLLLPDATLGAGELRLPALLKAGKRTVTEAAKAAADGPVLSAPMRFIKTGIKEAGATPTTLFNRLPLARQMETLPEVASPYRMQAPPTRVMAPRPAMDMGRLTGNKAPTLTDSLLEALNGAREGEKPTLISSHPPTDVVGAGPLKQSGKFGKSGNMGQPGGYTSGNPPMSDAEYDRLLQKFGGKEHSLLPGDTHPSVDASDWHSGAEPGSAEAQSAQSLHKETGAMDTAFKGKMDDPLASLLVTALLGGGSAGTLMSSHGDQ